MIPLSIPNINGNEWQYVKDCLDTGWISSAGAYVNKFEEAIQNYTGVKYAIACMNGISWFKSFIKPCRSFLPIIRLGNTKVVVKLSKTI